MLDKLNQRSSLLGVAVEHECPRCHQEVELPFGELCAECKANIEYRAKKISRIVAAISTVLLAVYLMMRLPFDQTSRLVGLAAILTWYIIVGLVTKRLLREFLK